MQHWKLGYFIPASWCTNSNELNFCPFNKTVPATRPIMYHLEYFPFGQNFQFNLLKCKWHVQIKQKFPETNDQPLEILHFFFSNLWERKLLFYLLKISPVFFFVVFMHHKVRFVIYQWDYKFGMNEKKKSLSIWHRKFLQFSTENFGLMESALRLSFYKYNINSKMTASSCLDSSVSMINVLVLQGFNSYSTLNYCPRVFYQLKVICNVIK